MSTYLEVIDVFLEFLFVVNNRGRGPPHQDLAHVVFQSLDVGHDLGEGLRQLQPLGDQMHDVLPLAEQPLERSLRLLEDDGAILLRVVLQQLADALHVSTADVAQFVL